MKALLTGILLVMVSTGFAQKTRKIEIFTKAVGAEILNATIYYNENGVITDTLIGFFAFDTRYPSLFQPITLCFGKTRDVFMYMSRVIDFCNSELPGTSAKIGNGGVRFEKSFGGKLLWLDEQNGEGYHVMNLKALIKIRDKYFEWAKKNQVTLQIP